MKFVSHCLIQFYKNSILTVINKRYIFVYLCAIHLPFSAQNPSHKCKQILYMKWDGKMWSNYQPPYYLASITLPNPLTNKYDVLKY